jgi:hypothetical protein
MQLNAVLPMNQVLRGVAAVSRRVLPRPVGLTSFGVRRTRSVVPQSAAAACVRRPSFGGRRTVWGGSRSGALGASGASVIALCAKVGQAACPSAVSARWLCAQAPRSTVRCSSALALHARRGRGCVERVALSPASCKRTCLHSFGASKLTGVKVRQFIGCSSAKSAPNPSVKRTA